MQLSSNVADLARQQARMLSMLEALTLEGRRSGQHSHANSPPTAEPVPPGDATVRSEVRAAMLVIPKYSNV